MRATIEVQTPHTEIVKKAMKTEIESSPYKKTSTTLKVEGNSVTIVIETDDISALRGTFNSYMNWLLTIVESLSL
jgi:tRNA threonylcarbamoyladenosine modification (KEOPS) complex  Pcc1 subunit